MPLELLFIWEIGHIPPRKVVQPSVSKAVKEWAVGSFPSSFGGNICRNPQNLWFSGSDFPGHESIESFSTRISHISQRSESTCGFQATSPYAPWCWNIYLHLPPKSTSFVGKYSTHGASSKGSDSTMILTPEVRYSYQLQMGIRQHQSIGIRLTADRNTER